MYLMSESSSDIIIVFIIFTKKQNQKPPKSTHIPSSMDTIISNRCGNIRHHAHMKVFFLLLLLYFCDIAYWTTWCDFSIGVCHLKLTKNECYLLQSIVDRFKPYHSSIRWTLFLLRPFNSVRSYFFFNLIYLSHCIE